MTAAATTLALGSRRWLFWLAVAAIAAAGLWLRCNDMDHVVQDDHLQLTDNDTVRRLARLRAIDDSDGYPVVEMRDGAPDGSVIHWTLPMDWCIRALDPIAAPFFPQAGPYEAGASVAGPLLATCSILVLAIGASALFGSLAGLLAALFYAFAYSVVNVSWFGNGDHQNLQHLALVGAALSLLRALAGSRSGLWGAVSGLLLGAAVWISTESQLFFLLSAGALALLHLVPATATTARTTARAWCAGVVVVMLLGVALEQESRSALRWDQVSWFQLYPALVFGVFLMLDTALPLRGAVRSLAAGGVALAGGVIVLLVTPLGDELGAQLDLFDDVNRWLQVQVSEYRSALVDDSGGFALQPLLARFSFLLLALPLLLPGLMLDRRTPLATRIALAVFVAGSFGTALWEVKLGHLFAMCWPLCLVVGARGLGQQWQAVHRPLTVAVGAAILLTAALTSLPARRSADPRTVLTDAAVREVCAVLRPRLERQGGTVLAPWDQGGHLMYLADAPVVASGYHRNLAGILDHLRLYTGTPDDEATLRTLLRARGVRWVVIWYDRLWLEQAPRVLASDDVFATLGGGQLRFNPLAEQTLDRRLRYGTPPTGFREVAQSTRLIRMGGEPEPMFRVFEYSGG